MNSDNRASSRFVWPPTIYALAAAVSGLLTWLVPLPFVSAGAGSAALVIGVLLIAAGVLMDIAAARIFRKAGTPVAPIRPTSALVTDGIYRRIRNPMYFGLSLILLGIALAVPSLWFLVALPVAIFAVTKLAIEPEERYLAERFGAAYLEYKSRVRRWGVI